MRGQFLLPALLAVGLSGCTGPGPGPDQRRAADDELNQSGRPYNGPAVVTSNPPADNNAVRLSCHPEGPGTECSR